MWYSKPGVGAVPELLVMNEANHLPAIPALSPPNIKSIIASKVTQANKVACVPRKPARSIWFRQRRNKNQRRSTNGTHTQRPVEWGGILKNVLVGGFNPFEKYASQIGSFPQGSG